MGRLILACVASVLLSTSVGLARTWYVPSTECPTIKAGIDSASAGDTVLVAAGTYTGRGSTSLDFGGTDLVLLSEAGPDLTIIDCEGLRRGFYFHSGETGAAVVEGFTVTNGSAADAFGGGMYCREASPTVSRCAFIGNWAEYGGGGIMCWDASPTIISCTLSGNSADTWGGGMLCWGSLTVSSCTFSGNSAGANAYGGGICVGKSSHAFIENTIIAFSPEGEAVWCEWDCSATMTCCDIFGNAGGDWVDCIADQIGINGNISACPSFCNALGGDLTLCDESPCAPGNHPDGYDCGLIGAWDVGCVCGPTATEGSTWGGIKSMYW